jgi:hypothetical protein
VKVFVSFSSNDVRIAEHLYADLVSAGAEVYQYGKSERSGVSSWEQVLTWINDSDVFIVLLSQSSLKSQPVKDEIDQAAYARSNSDGKKPAQLVPAIIESGVKPPILIERFATLDLLVYQTGMARLLKQLGLKPGRARPVTIPSLPDFSDLFFQYKTLSPAPRPATLWSQEAEQVLNKYKLVKPPDVSVETERKHIDALLAGKSSEYDALFLGFKPDPPDQKQAPIMPPLLRNKLLTFDWSGLAQPLTTPKLSSRPGHLRWTRVAEATAYVLEESADDQFKAPKEVYRGPETEFRPLALGFPSYRVKATGGVFRADGAWSNSTIFLPSAGLLGAFKFLDAPKLSGVAGRLRWTEVLGASSYVLEGSRSTSFEKPTVVYMGSVTSFNTLEPADLSAHGAPASWYRCFRVKATGPIGESPWSETVDPFASGKIIRDK